MLIRPSLAPVKRWITGRQELSRLETVYRLTLHPSLHTHIQQCPQFYYLSFLSLAYFLYGFSSVFERLLVMSGWRVFDFSSSIFKLTQDRNLSGPRYLFRPVSAPGQIIARIVRPAPYINMGPTWMLSKKHEGTSSDISTGERCPTFPAEFAAAGRDATALVISQRTLWNGRNLKIRPADYSTPSVEVHFTPCRCCRY